MIGLVQISIRFFQKYFVPSEQQTINNLFIEYFSRGLKPVWHWRNPILGQIIFIGALVNCLPLNHPLITTFLRGLKPVWHWRNPILGQKIFIGVLINYLALYHTLITTIFRNLKPVWHWRNPIRCRNHHTRI